MKKSMPPRISAPHCSDCHSQSHHLCTPKAKRVLMLAGTFVFMMLVVGYKSLMRESEAMLSTYDDESSLRVVQLSQHNNMPQPTFKIMTFNLRNSREDDGLNGWDYRKHHVADIIARYQPYIMGTQEGYKEQLEELKSLLKHPYERFGLERENDGEHEQIFYDPTVVERLEDGNFWLSEEPDTPWKKGWDAACVRMATWGKFRLLATQQVLYVFNTQLDHMGIQSRRESSKLLWDRIQKIAGDAPVFLIGDFNTYRYTHTYSYFTLEKVGPHFHEAWPEAAIQIGDVSDSYHGWAGIKNDDEKDAVRASHHIDWIFFRPQMTVLTVQVIIEDQNGHYPSDHYPIQAEFLFPDRI